MYNKQTKKTRESDSHCIVYIHCILKHAHTRMHIDMYINASMAAAVILLLSIFISNLL